MIQCESGATSKTKNGLVVYFSDFYILHGIAVEQILFNLILDALWWDLEKARSKLFC